MCVEWTNDWEVATEDMTAYKVVRKVGKRYQSPCAVHHRADQGWGRNAGAVLDYRLGKKIQSEDPGIYCTAFPMLLAEDDMVLLEVIIPKGTKFRRGKAGVPDESGQTFEMRTLNALCIKVVKEFRGKVDKRFNWPTSTPLAYNWAYITYSSSTTTAVTYWTP